MAQIKALLTVRNLAFVVSIYFFANLLQYFLTGKGGPLQLATSMVPVSVVLYVLYTIQVEKLYPGLSQRWNQVLATLYVTGAVVVFVYLQLEYQNLLLYRAGSYTRTDLVMGAVILLLIMEISRKLHSVLFWVNVALVFYTLFGYLSPIDFFWHPGTSVTRLISSSTLEMATGVFGRYPQMALTLIAAFLLLAAVSKAFEGQSAIIRVIYSILGRTKHNVPQVAVLSSAILGAVSGSGAANTAVTGSFTIPLMIRHGIAPAYAAAVETAASMGGLIMPPLMAVAGFIMADFLGVPYWDVVLRGFAMSFIYYSAVSMSVYLLSVRSVSPESVQPPAVPMYDKLKTLAFFTCIVLLVLMMGTFGYGPMRSAVYASLLFAVLLLAIYYHYKYRVRDAAYQDQNLLRIVRNVIETHADMTWYLVILMCTLGIMIGLFTVTGFINRMGSLLMNLGEVSIVLTILVAWVFGWLAGTGLPPTATYIVVAVVVVPPMTAWGISPWVAHFFVFLVAVWGELSPPTSLTAAVAAKIAETSFIRTMMMALKICLPILVMTFSIFIRTDLVVNPGLGQIRDTLLVTAGTLGLTFSIFGSFTARLPADIALRTLIALLALVPLFHPSLAYAITAGVLVAALLVVGVIQHRKVAKPPARPVVSATG